MLDSVDIGHVELTGPCLVGWHSLIEILEALPPQLYLIGTTVTERKENKHVTPET